MSQNADYLAKNIKLISLEESGSCKKNIKLSVEHELTNKHLDDSFCKIAKEISLPGFRKGKVPKNLLKEKFKDLVKEKWSDDLAQNVSQTALTALNIKLVSPAVYSWIEICEDKESKLELVVETYPQIPDFELDAIKPKSPPKIKPVSLKDVDEKVNSYLHALADWEDAPKITKDTRVSFCITKGSDKICDKKIFGQLSKELKDNIKGMSVLDSKNVEIDGEQVEITLEKIEKAKNLDIAEKRLLERFNVDSLEKLKNVIKERIEKHNESEFIEDCKKLIQKQFSLFFNFDLPQSLLDSEIDARSKNLKEKDGTTLNAITKESKDALRSFFVIEHIADKYKISLSDESKNFLLSQKNTQKNKKDMVLHRMATQLLNHEVLVFLVKNFGWIN